MRLTEGLSPEAFHVYRDLSKKLTAIGGQTAPVARLNAILFARHADIFANAVSKKTGEKLTAKDYYERFFGLDSEGKYKADLHQAMIQGIDLDEKVPVLDMDSMTNHLAGKTDKDILAYIRDLAPMEPIPTADFRALVGLPMGRYGHKHIIHRTTLRNTYTRNVVLSNMKDVLSYGRVVEITPNEEVRSLEGLTGTQLKTQRRKNRVKNYYRIMIPVKFAGRLETLVVTAEDMNGEISVAPQNVSLYEMFVTQKEEMLLPTDPHKGFIVDKEASPVANSVTQDAANSNSDEVTIRDMLSGISDYYGKPYINPDGTGNFAERFDQAAWHGSPYRFLKFLLEHIGEGEGAQAHGWGLYFARLRETSEKYKERLARRMHGTKSVQFTYDGMIIEEIPNELRLGMQIYENNARGDEKPEELMPGILKWEENDAKQYRARIEELDRLLKMIEDTPKITVSQLLKSVERYSYPDTIMRAAKPSIEGKRRTVADIKQELRSSRDLWEGHMREKMERIESLKRLDLTKIEAEDLTGSLYQVDIPEDDVLLDEQKSFEEQSPKVQKALDKALKKLTLDELENWGDVRRVGKKKIIEEIKASFADTDGKTIYGTFVDLVDSPKEASLILNATGIKGITYDGQRDGRCYVIFDDAVIEIIERLEQMAQAAQRVEQGYISRFQNGQRIVTLLKDADASTFLHEMGHLFLFDLEYLAQFDETSAQELAIVREWAEWHEGAAKEYARTKWADEFADREKAIRAALKKGDTAAVEKLKNEWRQERFARAFELYLYDGKAPAKGLRAVFRKFKTFLIQIYGLVTNDRVRASLAVQRVMDRMIATEEEIDAAALDDVYRDIEKVGGEKLLTESEEETHKRLKEEALEEAKSTLRARAMQDLTKEKQKEFEKQLAEERRRKEVELQEYPVYLAEAAIENSGSKDIVSFFGFKDFEEYHKVREEVGDLETHLNAHMAQYEKELDKALTERYLTDGAADALLMGSKYQAQRAALVEQALKKKLYALRRVDTKTQKLMSTVEEKIKELPEKINLKEKTPAQAELEKAIDVMKVAEKWKPEEYKALQDLADAATKEAFWNGFKKFQKMAVEKARRDRTQQKREEAAEYVVRNLGEGAADVYRDIAREMIDRMNIADACNIDKHARRVRESKKRVDKMIKAKKIDAAMLAQREVAVGYALIHEAQEVKAQVDKLRERVHKQLAARSVHLPKEERYWHRHLAYVLRLSKQDVKRPEGMEEVNLYQTLKRITGDLDANLDYDSVLAMEIAGQGGNFKGYNTLTLDEFKEMVDVLTMLYTTGRDRFKMKTVAGKDITEIVDEIITDQSDAQQMKRLQPVVGDDRGGMGYNDLVAQVSEKAALQGQKALAAITKPEEVLRALGENAHRYIYGTYERAAEKEGA
ncbi:hypothetical protein, partial [Selenomonas artemidis]|uniref:hypothetical protein n=1 Tax=Selenomonas artemidis TaxID=671224 RepID=UPI0023F0D24B